MINQLSCVFSFTNMWVKLSQFLLYMVSISLHDQRCLSSSKYQGLIYGRQKNLLAYKASDVSVFLNIKVIQEVIISLQAFCQLYNEGLFTIYTNHPVQISCINNKIQPCQKRIRYKVYPIQISRTYWKCIELASPHATVRLFWSFQNGMASTIWFSNRN